MEDVERMLICDVCGADACCGFGVTVEGIRMGDVGSWRCAKHHDGREQRYTREQWAEARAKGRLYPDSPDGEWRSLDEITADLLAVKSAQQAAE
jgi:hypothetical protein